MKIPVWVAELAAEFWRDVGEVEGFPRLLIPSIPRAGPLSVLLLADLSVCGLREWLGDNGIICEKKTQDRRLRAGLIARNGKGIAFIDGTDSDDEQRYSAAHELAHFLQDYWRLRRQVGLRLGAGALEVFDGLRPATPAERFHSLLRFTPISFYLHLLDRDIDGAPANSTIALAEEDADRLAFELLAPAEHIVTNVLDWHERSALQRALVNDYGFPRRQAVQYAANLLPSAPRGDPLLRTLKISN